MPKGIRKGKSEEKIKTHVAIPEQYKYYKNNNFETKDSFYYVSKTTYTKFLKVFFSKVVDAIITEGFEFVMPFRTGILAIRKYQQTLRYDNNGKVNLNNLPVNWNATLNLWEQDEEAKKQKKLIRYLNEDREIYNYRYIKKTANFKNKHYIGFRATRENKIKLKNAIKNNLVNCFNLF